MRFWRASSALTTNQRQELEANRFAIELLAPRKRLAPTLLQTPDLIHIAKLSDELHLSKEATARRYVELSGEPIAIVLSHNKGTHRPHEGNVRDRPPARSPCRRPPRCPLEPQPRSPSN